MFGGKREEVIQRDGEKCVKCGMTRAENRTKYGKDITVDHVDGRGVNVPLAQKNNDLSNLQTLCSFCHGLKDGPRRWKAQLVPEDIRDIRMFYARGMRIKDITAGYQMVSRASIDMIIHGHTWKWVTP